MCHFLKLRFRLAAGPLPEVTALSRIPAGLRKNDKEGSEETGIRDWRGMRIGGERKRDDRKSSRSLNRSLQNPAHIR